MEFLKKNYSVILFFFFCCFVVFFLLYLDNTYDALWEYGMSHAIRMGEVPYRDFNTVSTPLYIVLFSTGLFIYDSFSVYLLEFCLLYTVVYYFVHKMFGPKAIWFVLSLCIFLFHGFIPTYNAMAFSVLILLFYLEREKKSDFWIGFILGPLILSKHTIGLPVFVLTCIGVRDWKRILKRVNGCVIPLLIFCLYLVITGSFFSFLDLCFFGLFDFGSSNHLLINWCVVLTGIFLILIGYHLWKHPKNMGFYYALGAFFLVFPICDLGHFPYFFSFTLLPFLDLYQDKIKLQLLPYLLILVFVAMNVILRWDTYKEITFSPYRHFEGTFMYEPSIPAINEVVEEVSSHEKSVVIDGTGMFFNIIMDRPIDYFGVPLHGNYGYNGSQKMIQRIEKMHDTYFYLDYRYYDAIISGKNPDDTQFDVDIVGYVIDNSHEVGKVGLFTIYYYA